MSKLQTEIEKYVQSKRDIWSDRTVPVTRSVLTSLSTDWDNPLKNFRKLVSQGTGKYTIKIYFLIASRFEEQVYRTSHYRVFLQKNKVAFKNCYKDKTKLIQPEEFERFLTMYQTTNANMFNLLLLMGMAGLRISEALNAKWEDFEDGFLKVIGKGDKQRFVPFDLDSLVKTTSTGRIIGTCAYRFLFKRDLKPYTPHDFRAYYATCVANHSELSIKDAALLLGHASINTTSRYVRSDLNRIAKVLKKK